MKMIPTRSHRQLEGGQWEITVTPPKWSGFVCTSVVMLSQSQFNRYEEWLVTGGLIQVLLPDLTDGEREALMSGITPEEWQRAFGGDDQC